MTVKAPLRPCTRRARLLALACTPLLATFALSTRSLYADAIWTATGSGQWSTGANWSTDPVFPNGQDQNVFFSNSTLTNATVTLSAATYTVGSIAFDSAYGYTLAASAANLTLSTSAGNAAITVNNTNGNSADTISTAILFASPTIITNNDLPGANQNNLTLSGALSGSAPLTFNGAGQVVLSGNNANYTGAITITTGTLFASSSTALGSFTSATDGTTIGTGGTLAINTPAAVANEFITLNGGTLKANTFTAMTLNSPLSVAADSTITSIGHYNFSLNTLAGAGNLTLSAAAFTLAGAGPTNTFTGNVMLTNGASVNLTGSLVNSPSITVNPGTAFTFALPVGADPTLNSVAPGSVIANGGEVGVSADVDFRPALSANSTLSGILFNTANATLGGTNALDMNAFANPSTIRIGGTGSIASTMTLRPDLATHTYRFGLSDYVGNNLTVNAILTDQDGAPNNVDINGGTTTLAAANTYSGTTTIANGTLVITNANALGSASSTDADGTIVNANGTLRLGSNITLANEKITVNPNATLTANDATGVYANPITMNGGTLGTGTYTGTISGAGNFNVNGAVLAGTGNYTGNLTFIGTSTVAAASALSTAGNNILNNGTLTLAQPITVPLQINGGTLLLGSGVTLSSSQLIVTAGTLAAADTTGIYANSIIMNGGTLGNATFTGQIGGSGNFNISGATLSGIGTYTGIASFIGNSTITNAAALSPFGTTCFVSGNFSLSVPVAVPLLVNGANLTLDTPATSPITVYSGNATVNTSASGTLTADGGITRVNVPTNAALVLHGGYIGLMADGTYGGSVTMGGGTSWIFGSGNATLTQTLDLTGESFVAGSNITLNGGVSGAGDFYAGMPGSTGYNLTINGPITNSGSFHASSGPVAINSSNNFSAAVFVDGGTAAFNASDTFNALTISDGVASFNSPDTFNQPVIITGGNTTFVGGQTFIGGLSVTRAPTAAFVIMQGTNAFNGKWTIGSYGTITVNADNTVNDLSINGTLNVSAGVTLTSSDPVLDLESGQVTLTGTLAGVTTIVKSTAGAATLSGTGFSGPIDIQQGSLTSYSPLPTTSFAVSSAANATLTLWGNVSSSVALQNASGSNGTGALLLGSGAFSGSIDLGTIGSTIGLSSSINATPIISGPITGGSLTLLASSSYYTIQLTGQQNTYTGQTLIGSGTVQLIGSGRLTATSGVVLGYHGELRVDDSGTLNLTDRLADSIPISSDGGLLSLYSSSAANSITTEAVGTYTANSSLSEILAQNTEGNSADSTQVTLTLNAIARNPGATLQFDLGNTPNVVLGEKILIANTPTLHNGIIGGWAVVGPSVGNVYQTSFATYGASGIAAFTNSGTDINAAANTINVALSTSQTLASSKTINSLNILAGSLNLGGNTLTIDTGGLIMANSTIQNGNIAGGAFSNGELIVLSGGAISANIVDVAGTPTSLTFTGSLLTLSGNNTYSGNTIVGYGQLAANSAASVAPGNLELVDSRYTLEFTSTAANPVNVGNVHLIGSTSILGATVTPAFVQAASWTFDGGQIAVNLLGAGPASVNGYTNVNFSTGGSLASFQGNTTINNDGTLYISGSQSAALPLGGGTITVNSGGTLFPFGQTMTGNVVLNGGTFQSADYPGAVLYSFTGNLSVAASSSITALAVATPVVIAPGSQLIVNTYAELRGGITESGSTSTASLIVPFGSMLKSAAINVGILTVAGSAQITGNGTATGTSKLAQLAITGSPGAWSGSLDLTHNDLILEPITNRATALATLQDQITFGHTHSAGVFTSSTLAPNTALAVVDNSDLAVPIATFGGFPVDPNALLVGAFFIGDANADGTVDLNDLNIVLNNLGTTTSAWTSGNFDGGATIDLNDLNDVLNNLGATFSNPSFSTQHSAFSTPSPTTTPEPASLAALALAPFLLFRRRSRR